MNIKYTQEQIKLFDEILTYLLSHNGRAGQRFLDAEFGQGSNANRERLKRHRNELESLGFINFNESNRLVFLTAKGEAHINNGGFSKFNSNSEMELPQLSENDKIHSILKLIVDQENNNGKECFTPNFINDNLDIKIPVKEIEYLCSKLIIDNIVRDARSQDSFQICTKEATSAAFYGNKYKDQAIKVSPMSVSEQTKSNKVFIVHGHNELMKSEVARTVDSFGLKSIILHEQPNKGRTTIEKLIDHSSDVSFAIVLLSGDDKVISEGDQSIKLRARQNVIFELGLFIGKLDRSKVIALYENKTNFEMPTDYAGVQYIPYDSNWKHDLLKELKEAGLPVKI